MWEKYCLHCCFVTPDRFLLPDKDEPMNEFEVDDNVLTDQQSDSDLDIPRNRLSQLGFNFSVPSTRLPLLLTKMGNCVMVLARWIIDSSLPVRCPVVAPSVQPPPAQFAKPLAAYDFGFFRNAISRVQYNWSFKNLEDAFEEE